MSKDQVQYRELEWDDFPSFQKLMLQAPGDLERAIGFDQLSDALFKYMHRRGLWTLFALMKALGRAPVRFFVGVNRDQIVGSAGLILLPKAGYVFAVVTDQTTRNRGIASHILGEIHSVTRKKGRPWLALDVDPNNETALRLYRKLGYEERAQFNYHVGPTPQAITPSGDVAVEVSRGKMKEVADWVNLHQLPALRDPLPATSRMFSHIENMANMPNTQRKTWILSPSGQIKAVLRGFYFPAIKTSFMIPIGYDSAISSDSILSLMAPAVKWTRALEAIRMEVVVSEPAGAWEPTMASLSLPTVVSSKLMIRPTTLTSS